MIIIEFVEKMKAGIVANVKNYKELCNSSDKHGAVMYPAIRNRFAIGWIPGNHYIFIWSAQ